MLLGAREVMKQLSNYVVKAFLDGAIVVVPIYLAILLLLKAAGSLVEVVRPIASAFPEWMPAENVLSLLLLMLSSASWSASLSAPGRGRRRGNESRKRCSSESRGTRFFEVSPSE